MIPDYMFLTQEASNIALYNIGYDLEIRFTNDFLVNLTLKWANYKCVFHPERSRV